MFVKISKEKQKIYFKKINNKIKKSIDIKICKAFKMGRGKIQISISPKAATQNLWQKEQHGVEQVIENYVKVIEFSLNN